MRSRAVQLNLFEEAAKPVHNEPAARSVLQSRMKPDPPGYDFLKDVENQVYSLSQLVEGGMSLEEIKREFSEEEIQALVDSDEPESAELRQYLRLRDRQERKSSTSSPSGRKRL